MKLTTICDVSHVIGYTWPSSPLFSGGITVPQAFRVDFCVFWCFLCVLSHIFFNPAQRSPKVGKNVDKSLLIIAVG